MNENCIIPDQVSLKDDWLKETDDKKGDDVLQWLSKFHWFNPKTVNFKFQWLNPKNSFSKRGKREGETLVFLWLSILS